MFKTILLSLIVFILTQNTMPFCSTHEMLSCRNLKDMIVKMIFRKLGKKNGESGCFLVNQNSDFFSK